TSHGVPMIGCRCPVCASDDPRNQRARPCILLELPQGKVLIDTPPELRLQCIRFGVNRVDAVLYTHAHADHLFGLDDIRRFNELQGGEIPLFAEHAVLETIRRAFAYVFMPTQAAGGKPLLNLHLLDGQIELCGATIEPLRVYHGELPILAFRVGGFAYVTDVSYIPAQTEERLQGLEWLFLDAVRYEPHPTHYCLEQAIEVVRRLEPRRAAFVHLSHDYDHEATNALLPEGMELAYDGMRVSFTL
ncbi:MAG: MBL fold metallo-hydrolase, partial [bacterium]|nr:MBL fold metallo-hydrolase [bacterium]